MILFFWQCLTKNNYFTVNKWHNKNPILLVDVWNTLWLSKAVRFLNWIWGCIILHFLGHFFDLRKFEMLSLQGSCQYIKTRWSICDRTELKKKSKLCVCMGDCMEIQLFSSSTAVKDTPGCLFSLPIFFKCFRCMVQIITLFIMDLLAKDHRTQSRNVRQMCLSLLFRSVITYHTRFCLRL